MAHVANWENTIVVQLALQTRRTHSNSNKEQEHIQIQHPIKNRNRMKSISQP
jgi:hypothetical protein